MSDVYQYCLSCGDEMFALGPVCCAACAENGACAVCGQHHRAWQCPEVVKVRLEMAAAAELAQETSDRLAKETERRQTVSDWAAKLLAEYMAAPIWQEAA